MVMKVKTMQCMNHAVHEPCSVGYLCDGICLKLKHGIPVMDSGINNLWFQEEHQPCI